MDTQWLVNMFTLTLPVIEKILRPVIVYFFLIVGLRVSGKRELAQLNPFDLVVLLTISNTVQNAIIGNDNSVTGGLIGVSALLVTNYLFVRYLYRRPKLEAALEGKTDYLIENGQLNQQLLEKDIITIPELQAAARKQGYPTLDLVQTATIEPGGSISFIPKYPSPNEIRHAELVSRLDQLAAQVSALQAEITKFRPV